MYANPPRFWVYFLQKRPKFRKKNANSEIFGISSKTRKFRVFFCEIFAFFVLVSIHVNSLSEIFKSDFRFVRSIAVFCCFVSAPFNQIVHISWVIADMAFYLLDDFESRHSLKIQLNSVEPTVLILVIMSAQLVSFLSVLSALDFAALDFDFSSRNFHN